MATHGDASVGERLAQIRRRRRLTQEQLAERADVSVDVVRKLEQRKRHSALMSTFTKLARALDYVCATPFGPTNVAIASVNAAVEIGEYGRALERAKFVPAQGQVSSTWRSRYLIDVAIAQSESGREEAAVDSLVEAERIAPGWMRYHTLARDTVRELAEREKRRRSRVGLLADRLGIEV